MCYQHVVLEGRTLLGSFMSGTQTHKETSQDRLDLNSDPPRRQAAAHVDRFHPAAHIGGSSNALIAGRVIPLNLCYSTRLWEYTLTQMSSRERKTTRIFYLQPYPNTRASSHTLRINISQALPSMRPTNQQCMTAPESCSSRMPGPPYRCISLHKSRGLPLIYVWAWSPGMWGIIHISLTGPVMYVYSRVVQCVYTLTKDFGREKAIDLRPTGG